LRQSFLLFCLLFLSCLFGHAQSQEEPTQVASKDGLILTFSSAEKKDRRVTRLAALYVPEGASPTAYLLPGKLSAVFEGFFELKKRSKLSFSFKGRGKVKLTIGDDVLLEAEAEDLSKFKSEIKRIRSGRHAIKIEYHSPDKGPAQLRLFWAGRDFLMEAVPPAQFSHQESDILKSSLIKRRGRQLFAEQRCIKCHIPRDPLPAGAMPELKVDAPDLSDVGFRLNEKWMGLWIQNPKALRPQSQMPSFHNIKASEALDMAAFLKNQQHRKKRRMPTALKKEESKLGAVLFNSLRCVSCHTLPDDKNTKPSFDRIPLNLISTKWQQVGLIDFLQQPNLHYKHTRMPNFKLSAKEVRELAAYLIFNSPARMFTQQVGDSNKGAALIQSAGCINCHSIPIENKFKTRDFNTIFVKDWSSNGCVADKRPNKSPVLNLSASDKKALQAFGKSGFKSLTRHSLAEHATRQYKKLRCQACHQKDKANSFWMKTSGEAKKLAGHDDKHLAQEIPTLSWAGEKLKHKWLAAFIKGEVKDQIRPWLSARMPAFETQGLLLAEGLAQEHGLGREDSKTVASKDFKKEGLSFVTQAGCNVCHGIAEKKPMAQFEFGAPNLKFATERLRQEYFTRWMMDPLRVQKTTMIKHSSITDGKATTPFPILGGDALKQYEAVWQYLKSIQNKK
jgi:mono/diheme cytochrome c family protein